MEGSKGTGTWVVRHSERSPMIFDMSAAESFCILCERRTRHFPLFRLLKRCENCSLVSAREELLPEAAGSLYGENYFFEGEYLDYLQEKKSLQKNFQKWIKILKRFAPSGKFLEIGSAYGFFVELARKEWEGKGIDISGPACEYACSQGLEVECGDFLEIPVEKGAYQIVCLWDTIEHLTAPQRYIEKAAEVTASGGILALTTGDIDAWLPKIQREKWRMIHPPTHLYYFSQKTLTRLLARHHFQIVYAKHVGLHRDLKRVLYNLSCGNRRNFFRSLYRLCDGINADLSSYVNLFDILFVVARKN